MHNFFKKIDHPWIALGVIFLIGALLSQYGITAGSLLLFDLFAGIAIYRIFCDRD